MRLEELGLATWTHRTDGNQYNWGQRKMWKIDNDFDLFRGPEEKNKQIGAKARGSESESEAKNKTK